MTEKEITELSLAEVAERIRKRKLTSEEVTKACFKKIKETGELNAIVSQNKKAIIEAKEIDKKLMRGEKVGVLAGVPIVLKDNMCTADELPTGCSSRFLKTFVSPYDATVVKKLKAAGAILLGKANMDEFAMGNSNETGINGKVLNPHDKTRVSGGSSGGSAVSVAAHQCFAALGSDTGGSIRQPSSLCGVVGMKPTYGTVSRFGIVAFASSLDQVGPITKTVKDNALMLDVIAGADENDATCSRKITKPFSESFVDSIAGKRIGVAKEYFDLPMETEVKSAVEKVIEFYKINGAKVVDISLPNVDKALAVYYVLSSAEAASNLSRFDGIRYGERVEGENVIDTYYKSRTNGFGDEVKRRIMLGNYVLSSGFYEAYYKKSTRVQQISKR